MRAQLHRYVRHVCWQFSVNAQQQQQKDRSHRSINKWLEHLPSRLWNGLMSAMPTRAIYTRIHGDKVERGERGDSFEEFAISSVAYPTWMLYRGQVGGDLWHFGGKVSRYHVLKVADSVSHLRNAWTYTHHKPDRHNAPTIREAIKRGFTINISTDGVKNKVLRKEGLDDAVRYFKRGLPTVCAVPADSKPTFVHKGVTFVQCPEQRSDKIQCATCNNGNPFCSQADRNFVVTFNLH